VTRAHFAEAFERVQPSVSASDQRRYDALKRKLRATRGSLDPAEKKSGGGEGEGEGEGGDGGGDGDGLLG
jgi:uncharacterized membrane protein